MSLTDLLFLKLYKVLYRYGLHDISDTTKLLNEFSSPELRLKYNGEKKKLDYDVEKERKNFIYLLSKTRL